MYSVNINSYIDEFYGFGSYPVFSELKKVVPPAGEDFHLLHLLGNLFLLQLSFVIVSITVDL